MILAVAHLHPPLDCALGDFTGLLLDTVRARHPKGGGGFKHGIGSASDMAHRGRWQYEGSSLCSWLLHGPLPHAKDGLFTRRRQPLTARGDTGEKRGGRGDGEKRMR
jgi:hypothetical protein